MAVLAESAQLARALERNRIAREMHDIIAHTLSGITALSDGARYAAGDDPARATAALEDISAESRRALNQVRELVSVLRTDDARDVRAVPGTADLRALVDQAISRGLELSVEGLREIPADLDEMTQFTLYRITQEMLSNMVRHADSACSLSFRVTPKEITVRSSNPATTVGEGGFGLTGMSERARARGGSFSSELHDGVFIAEAVLPR
ncbi:sensor histidine kinase [uncultured Corynebacterium sp.]|uniref:sensor histidine kinase n=1 Tax=uncultured Corynebacterium sp. TaxID=159447 RepID=UPI0025938866|nr:histidine kinase [uncultured Corynebacterium sp.]